MIKPSEVFNLTGADTIESGLGLEYSIVFLLVHSRSINSLPISRLRHSKNPVGPESTFINISPDTVPPALVKAFVST